MSYLHDTYGIHGERGTGHIWRFRPYARPSKTAWLATSFHWTRGSKHLWVGFFGITIVNFNLHTESEGN
jgi:hypothetical protein